MKVCGVFLLSKIIPITFGEKGPQSKVLRAQIRASQKSPESVRDEKILHHTLLFDGF